MKNFIAPLLSILLLASCAKERLTGSGAVVTEDRAVASFIKVTTSGAANVYIQQGADFSVKVKGYGNLLPHFETLVRNQTLEVGYKDVQSIKNDNVEVFVTMPVLAGARINGSADVEVMGDFTSNRMDFFISGSGNIDVESGTVQNLSAEISGSGNIRLFGISASKAEVGMSGSGTIEVNAATELKAKINGSGTIFYKGSPAIESSISGSGRLVHRP